MGNAAWWKLKTVEAPIYHRGAESTHEGDEQARREFAMMLKDGCIYCASHVDLPPVTVVNGRRLRKEVWPVLYEKLKRVRVDCYGEAAEIVRKLNEEHGHCWTTIYRGNDGDLSLEFLSNIHESHAKKLPEDPFLSPRAAVKH